ncbi:hypothetical protein AVL50_22570 [Flammeovirga sp. SJP92]|nr:hypothetical protein AVL50_22570 [Flammeovirga sp. SJP92]
MKKVINFTVLSFSLFIIEVIITFFVMLSIDLSRYGYDQFYLYKALNSTGMWNFWRVLFFGVPYILLFFLFFKFLNRFTLSRPILLSFINLFIYIFLSISSRIIWGKNIPLPPEGVMFWVTCVSIVLAPFIIRKITFCKNLMKYL